MADIYTEERRTEFQINRQKQRINEFIRQVELQRLEPEEAADRIKHHLMQIKCLVRRR